MHLRCLVGYCLQVTRQQCIMSQPTKSCVALFVPDFDQKQLPTHEYFIHTPILVRCVALTSRTRSGHNRAAANSQFRTPIGVVFFAEGFFMCPQSNFLQWSV